MTKAREQRPPMVVADDVHVAYRVRSVAPRLRTIVARGQDGVDEVVAVRGVSFRLDAGEALAVIGPNGSGKSTLMRAVAGLLPLASGAVWARTRPRLLGVSAALQPDLSGRANILVGGTALGLRRSEVEQRVDDVIAFSGLGKAIERPIRTYSSGMRARLQFAISTTIAPEILIIDEALSVGDRDFRARSRARIDELLDAAGSVLFVSHSMRQVSDLCDRALWLQDGRVQVEGAVDDVIAAYEGTAT